MAFPLAVIVVSWAMWWFVNIIAIATAIPTVATPIAEKQPSFPPQKVQQCSEETGGGICPLKNTCCRLRSSGRNATTSGCIPSDLGAFNGECCADQQNTGCGVGYQCSTTAHGSLSCTASPNITDPLVQTLPRYPLCRQSSHSNVQQIQGFTVPNRFGNPQAQMLYYTSHPDIRWFGSGIDGTVPIRLSPQDTRKIRMIWIVVHGANRNADDYFCAASAAISRQERYRAEEVILVVPRFVVPSDLSQDPAYDHVLQWDDTPDGPWRYGANAIWPRATSVPNDSNISSFDVLDAMVDAMVRTQFPNLQHIVVAGHSSGGQFVQRWALLSPYAGKEGYQNGIPIRHIVANPSSFAYLIPERYNATTQQWVIPQNTAACPEYNTWEWGLELSHDTPAYVRNILKGFRNETTTVINETVTGSSPYQALVERFAKREVVYLAGSQDRCNVSSTSSSSSKPQAWCQSHGLERTCQDELQGLERMERHNRYMQMLQQIPVVKFEKKYHSSMIVPGVGHDHSLMFSSPVGLQAIFGEECKQTLSTTS